MFISRSFTSSSVHKDFDSLVTLHCSNYLTNIISQLNSTQASLFCNQSTIISVLCQSQIHTVSTSQ